MDDPSPSSRVTLRDIAKATGYHFTTVGLALRDSPKISREVRGKIREAAETMGYRPDPVLSSLMVYRARKAAPRYRATIAWLNNWPKREEMYAVPSFQAYFDGACQRGRQFGYLFEEFWLREPGMTPLKLRRILKARGIDAVLIAPQPQANMFPDLHYEDFAAIAFGYSFNPAVLHVVASHQAHVLSMLLSQLRRLGYRRIGLYASREWNAKVDNSLVSGLMGAQWEHPELPAIPPLIQVQEEEPAIRRWLEEHQPDVIVSYNTFLDTLRRMGYRVPEDFGFASMAVEPRQHSIAGIYQNDFLIGQIAVDLVVGMLQRHERGIPETPIRTLVEGVWIPGETVRALAPS